MRVYVVERFKRTAGHWGCLHTFLKNNELLGVTGTFTHYFKVDGDAETHTGAQVVHLLRRTTNMTLWSWIGKSVTFTGSIKPLGSK